ESTQVQGVTPHIHIPSIRDQADLGEGKMDNALKFDKVNPLPVASLKLVTPTLVQDLDTRSRDRRKASPKFQKQEERIAKYVERKARHAITLNEDKFRAEFVTDDELTKDDDKPKKGKDKKKYTEHPAWSSDFYNDEVINIVADYLSLGSKVLANAPGHASNTR